MRRIIGIATLLIISVLAVWAIFDVFASPLQEARSANSPIAVYDETDQMLKADSAGDLAAPVTDMDRKIAPVFDSTGALSSDPTGTMFNAAQSGDKAVPATLTEIKIAPVFDSTGALSSDPTGTMYNANPAGALAIPVTGTDSKIAPVFDTTGTITSDPSGTILSGSNP